MKVIIDRFEGNYAIVELPDRTMADLPALLVPGAKAGDVILISISEEETEQRKKAAESQMRRLWVDE